jgi:hypothetical protein
MATSSLHKEFVVKDKKAFEQLKKDIEEKANLNTTVEVAHSLEEGEEILKHFSFR